MEMQSQTPRRGIGIDAGIVVGLLILVAGVILLLDQIGVADMRTLFRFWPVALIVYGMIWAYSLFRRDSGGGEGWAPVSCVNDVTLFAGIKRQPSGEFFDGGSATTLFGEYKLDLTDAQMRGPRATLNVTTIFGDTEIRVPEDWSVVMQSSTLLGDCTDKTWRPALGPETKGAETKELIVDGVTLLGALKVRN